jgi:hypothetical protein
MTLCNGDFKMEEEPLRLECRTKKVVGGCFYPFNKRIRRR